MEKLFMLYSASAKVAPTGTARRSSSSFNDQYLGTDTTSPSNEIKSEMAAGTGNIDVTCANYKNNDPLCCPSGQPVTIRYHWNGTRLIPSGRPPGH
jgi:LppP/LprE lipoprotein